MPWVHKTVDLARLASSEANSGLDLPCFIKDFFVRFDSLPASQQFFSYVETGLPGLNEYYKQGLE